MHTFWLTLFFWVVFLPGRYTRNCSVSNSSFTHIGDNAMASWGYTHDTKEGIAAGNALPKGTGVDGTGGAQPRYTAIVGNVVREIGLNERQSSAWSEAKACLSHVKGNLIYNIPRAAIKCDVSPCLTAASSPSVAPPWS